MKYLLLFGLLAIVWWQWRKRQAEPPPAPPPRPAERMVACAQCGVHLPLSESVSDGRRHFCCEEHRQVAGGAGQ